MDGHGLHKPRVTQAFAFNMVGVMVGYKGMLNIIFRNNV
jgi:hypothetical protein